MTSRGPFISPRQDCFAAVKAAAESTKVQEQLREQVMTRVVVGVRVG